MQREDRRNKIDTSLVHPTVAAFVNFDPFGCEEPQRTLQFLSAGSFPNEPVLANGTFDRNLWREDLTIENFSDK